MPVVCTHLAPATGSCVNLLWLFGYDNCMKTAECDGFLFVKIPYQMFICLCRFYLPHGLTVDHEDNLWLTDVGSHQVC